MSREIEIRDSRRQRWRLRVGGLCTLIKGPISSSLSGHFLKLSEVYFGRLHLLPLSLSVGFCVVSACRSTPTDPFIRGVALGADCSRLMSASFGRVAVIVAEP